MVNFSKFNIEHIGAIIVTIVLIVLSMFSLLFLLAESFKTNSIPEKVVDKVVQKFHPDMNLDWI